MDLFLNDLNSFLNLVIPDRLLLVQSMALGFSLRVLLTLGCTSQYAFTCSLQS